jgi:hypothetical protein
MIRQLFIHGVLLFALLFQSLAHAVPCCADLDLMQSETIQLSVTENMDQHAQEGCVSGSPLCCVIPSLTYKAVILDSQTVSPVHVPTVTTLLLSQHQIPLDRPPRA